MALKKTKGIKGFHCLSLFFAFLFIFAGTVTSDQTTPSKPARGKRIVLQDKKKRPIRFTKSASEMARVVKGKVVIVVKSETRTPDGLSQKNVLGVESELRPVYYKNGVKRPSHRYISTGRIIVSFGKTPSIDYHKFARDHELKFLRLINRKYQTAVFELLNKSDPIQQVNELNLNPSIRSARPDWISPRKLR